MSYFQLDPNRKAVLEYMKKNKRWMTLQVISNGVQISIWTVKRALIMLKRMNEIETGVDFTGKSGHPPTIYCYKQYVTELSQQ
jgi:response regulator of citrate/malate metabolism